MASLQERFDALERQLNCFAASLPTELLSTIRDTLDKSTIPDIIQAKIDAIEASPIDTPFEIDDILSAWIGKPVGTKMSVVEVVLECMKNGNKSKFDDQPIHPVLMVHHLMNKITFVPEDLMALFMRAKHNFVENNPPDDDDDNTPVLK